MFERYLTDALTKHFGHLVDNVDAEKVRLSAWNGKLVLEDVLLRSDALDSFVEQCPVELAFGKVGRLDVQVPWSLVGAQLWKRKRTKKNPEAQEDASGSGGGGSINVILSDVNILITPRRKFKPTPKDSTEENLLGGDERIENDNEKSDEVLRKRKGRERKEKAVQELLDAQLLSRVASSSHIGSRWQWLQDWLSNLISNLSVTARNIHIRYEDPGHSMGFAWSSSAPTRGFRRYRKAFAVGITLGDFSVKTARQQEGPEASNRDGPLEELPMKRLTENGDEETDLSSLDRPSSPESVPSHHSTQQVDEQQPKAYRIRCKTATAKQLAIYWDSGGCALISEMAPVDESQTTGKHLLLERTYVESAFTVLNGGCSDKFSDEPCYRAQHTYLLDPVSPSVNFALVTKESSFQPAIERDTGISNPPSSSATPPSSINITLPPTLFCISRQTLEDTVYIRKSLDVWMQAKKGILSDKSLRRLAKLRPLTSAVEDPQGWWKYAVQATIAFMQVGRAQEAIHGELNDNKLAPTHSPNKFRGWPGLARALGRRRRYVSLYQELFDDDEEKDDAVHGPLLPRQQLRTSNHNSLLELEDELTAPEISAFRMAAYFAITGCVSNDLALENLSTAGVEPTNWESIEKIISKTTSETATDSSLHPPSQRLSLGHRCSMFLEMGQALEREKQNMKIQQQEEEEEHQRVVPGTGRSSDLIDQEPHSPLWQIQMSCREMSLQIDDRQPTTTQQMRGSQGTHSVPVVRLSCACVIDSNLYRDGSWDVDCAIAALKAEDLGFENQQHVSPDSDLYRWRTLVGPQLKDCAEELLLVDGTSFQQSVRLSVRRTVHSSQTDNAPRQKVGSITQTSIRLFPLEIVYSTLPVEALSRILATVKTPELSDDYHRMAGRVYEWREKQKKRLLQALAHKGKKIIVDVDVAAPVLLIPEAFDRDDSPMLVLDLGHLHFSNAPKQNETVSAGFDDAWWLSLTNVQVQCSTTRLYQETLSTENTTNDQVQHQSPQQVVERFSLEISILTQIGEEGDDARVKVAATLPRLSFNLTSSSVRLLNRLRCRWTERKHEVERAELSRFGNRPSVRSALFREENSGEHTLSSKTGVSKRGERVFEFQFSAPLITIGLENDVDGRSVSDIETTIPLKPLSTPIVSLAVHGIGGSLLQKVSKSGSTSTEFDARLQSLLAVDHYQTAGNDYALLVSSLDPAIILNNSSAQQQEPWKDLLDEPSFLPASGKDLVLVEFASDDDPGDRLLAESTGDRLSIAFHELYVEWNPETIAAIQKAVRMPPSIPLDQYKIVSTPEERDDEDSDDEFFDAEEDVFFDTLAKNADPMNSSLTSPLSKLTRKSTIALLSNHGSSLKLNGSSAGSNYFDDNDPDQTETPPLKRSFEIVFNLSKLHVNFNKEARHRRILTAEMDGVLIQYITRRSGGSKTVARLGNLVFSDPSAVDCRTLYSQILGLQNGANGSSSDTVSSLLEMAIVSNPKTRRTVQPGGKEAQQVESPVSLCYDNGSVLGCDTYVNARFSPMRFVYLQQLWSEIVDYFFEGVMGFEVMGKVRPIATVTISESGGVKEENKGLPDDDLDPYRISFTKFNFSIDSPVVIFPVTYRSPQFLKLCAAQIDVTNEFDCKADDSCGDVARWHNNCSISFQSLRVSSWDGKDISHSRKSVAANVRVRWPIGPIAPFESPKWNVSCKFDSLDFTLRRDDYSLLQNVVSFNVGDESRHLDEWDALQNLSAQELDDYKESIMVHFGYDRKDVAPTTYHITLGIPLVRVNLEAESGTTVGIAKCSNFAWGMTKLADRISRQKVKCDIDLVHPRGENEVETLLLSVNQSDRAEGKEDILPELTYTSTSKPSGDNVKTLNVVDACIYLVYPAWKALMGFFSGLPEADILSAEEVAMSVQIGDRWYRITSGADHGAGSTTTTATSRGKRFSWIDSRVGSAKSGGEEVPSQQPDYQLRVTLSSPCIILSSSNSADPASVVLRLDHLDFLHTKNGGEGASTKSFFLHDLEVYTSSQGNGGRNSDSSENSLIHPWCVSGVTQSCSGGKPCSCESHSIQLGADVLRARAAFSDMMIAIEVCLHFLADLRQKEHPNRRSTGYSDPKQSPIEVGASQPKSVEASSAPKQYVLALDWSGFEFLVVDDSGRHFAGSRELITLVLGKILFLRQDNTLAAKSIPQSDQLTGQEQFSHKMTVRLESIDLLDCLQPEGSPFRLLVSSHAGAVAGQHLMTKRQTSAEGMDWDTFAMQESGEWGYSASPALIERTDTAYIALATSSTSAKKEGTDAVSFSSLEDGGDTRSYAVRVRSCSMQYNPSTVIALQRFLGRFKKQAVKSLQVVNEEIDKLMQASYRPEAEGGEDAVSSQDRNVTADIKLESLSISLNKEHQHRRLLRVDLLGCNTTLSSKKTGLEVEGSVRDLSAWDCDQIAQQAASSNRHSPNTCVLRVLRNKGSKAIPHDDSFLQFRFSTFSKDHSSPIERDIPSWVRSHTDGHDVTGQEIDDCLEVSLATIELTYFRDRTEEILDYLSNGLPGKGMGATSKAAQGFLKKRIQTRSFLQLRVQSPTVYVPEGVLASRGMRLRLGDVELHSWFEGGTITGRIEEIDLSSGLKISDGLKASFENLPEDQTDWWRMLSLKIANFSAGVFERKGASLVNDGLLNQPLDLSLILQKSTWHGSSISLKCRVSDVNMTLKYSQYCLIYGVMKGNLGKKIDKEKWDNIEKAYDLEIEQDEGQTSNQVLHRVEYASGARHVRYGQKSQQKEASENHEAIMDHSKNSSNEGRPSVVDLRFAFDGFALKFRRDDPMEEDMVDEEAALAFDYDMILLRVQLVEVSISNRVSNDFSLQLSLYRIGLFDLGDHGRRARESFARHSQIRKGGKNLREIRSRCAFTVLIEGYSKIEDDEFSQDTGTNLQDEPQLVVTVDRVPASSAGSIGSLENTMRQKIDNSTVTVAKVVLNLLSVNAILRPFRELTAFLARSWPMSEGSGAVERHDAHDKTTVGANADQVDRSSTSKQGGSSGSCVQVKLVAHYPRIFFVADETDKNSRALVLRGLAVINAGRTVKTTVEDSASVGQQADDVQSNLVVDAQVHSLESYINPDVNMALGLQQRHADMLKNVSDSPLFAVDDTDPVSAVNESLGVALLQPVTTGIEFGKSSRSRFPSRRFLCVNVEPISTMLSFDDLQLIESVLKRLRSERSASTSTEKDVIGMDKPETVYSSYDVVFRADHLGLGLRKQGDNIVVDEVTDGENREIQIGDILTCVEGRKLATPSLSDVVRQLATVSRPTTVTFLRYSSNSRPRSTAPAERLGASQSFDKPDHAKTGTFYTLHFRRGMPNGLSLEKSLIGDIPVVTRVHPCLVSALISDADTAVSQPLPKTGALVTHIDGLDSAELGFVESMAAISKQRDSCESLEADTAGDKSSYELTFVERESSNWGHHDCFDLSLQGAILTFIDDLNGRDMPLLRGNLTAVELHLKRGMGINTYVLERIKRFPCLMHDSSNMALGTDSTVTLSAVAKTTLDYFHPRKAVYEPLVEPAKFCILYECTRSTGIQDQVAVEVSDRLLQNVASFHQTCYAEPQLLCLNFSDASAEVLARAMCEWKNWRSSVKKRADLSLFPDQLAGHVTSSVSSQGLHLVSDQDAQHLGNIGGTDGHKAKPAAASNAAHAAFIFAQKRGAEKSGKSESSKPFVFRNRTGVSIAFVQQQRTEQSQLSGRMNRSQSRNSLVGEYKGLEHYLRGDVTELSDGEDAKFQMEVLRANKTENQETTKRVRNYEGQFPCLAVAIQAIAGVLVEPLNGLQVQKAGTSIRHLSVQKSESDATDSGNNTRSQYVIPVVWRVEVEDNRRIVTISSAVRIVSLSTTVGIEIGVRKGAPPRSFAAMPAPEPCEVDVVLRDEPTDPASGCPLDDFDDDSASRKDTILDNSIEHQWFVPYDDGSDDTSAMQTVGVSLHGSPVYLPLWLAMRLEPVCVHVRPKMKGPSQYSWGTQSVLFFAPLTLASVGSGSDWCWQETSTEALGSISCTTIEEGAPTAFLSCYASGLILDNQGPQDVDNLEGSLLQQPVSVDEVLSVSIDSGLTLRNLLPVEVEWEAAHGLAPGTPEMVDGSSYRTNEQSIERSALKTGECAEVFSNYKVESLTARFRLKHGDTWSEWALVSSPMKEERKNDRLSTPTNREALDLPSIFQTNVQVDGDFGAPITLGIRVVPKISKDDRSQFEAVCFGIDVIVYAELWISNLTSLPLTFGCPTLQIFAKSDHIEKNHDQTEVASTQFSAEAALMEIASVLELGEKGSKMDTRNANLAAAAGEIFILPKQESPCIVEELFEFVEMEGTSVKRRWWASESYWNLRDNNVLELSDDGKPWHWIDETWKIDCTGQASVVSGGWESCNDLIGSGEGPFSPHRQFVPVHPFRRRRWFRTRSTFRQEVPLASNKRLQSGHDLLPGLQVFHHPIHDSFSKAQERNQRKRNENHRNHFSEETPRGTETDQPDSFNIAVKCGDGRWSAPASVSSRGKHHGAVQVFASRWPSLTRTMPGRHANTHTASRTGNSVETSNRPSSYSFGAAPLNPALHELVYHVKEVDGDCGEFSRLMLVSARYSVRNDSERKTIEIKQSGTKDSHAVQLSPGEIAPFYWLDCRLPQLVCVRPLDTAGGANTKVYKWSGGFDVRTLGMTALLIRPLPGYRSTEGVKEQVRSIRTLVELRPGTGGLGVNISFKAERHNGDGALFRIENRSTFNIWLSQDGVLVDPSLSIPHPAELDGDLIRPGDQISFGLDIPYRQGKYAGRQAATMSELLRVRVGLAPLSSRAGIETTKVIGLSIVGESVRLKPSKLISVLSEAQLKAMERVRVLAVTTADGPSRVLKFCLMANPDVENVLGSVFMDSVSYAAPSSELFAEGAHVHQISEATALTQEMLVAEELLTEPEAKRQALFGEAKRAEEQPLAHPAATAHDTQISFRVSFSGFLLSLVDSSPSEICTIAVNNVNALTKWSLLRTSDASLLMSIGWLQVDNHIPSASFPVATSPEGNETKDCSSSGWATPGISRESGASPPLLFVGIEFAPQHSSGIVCLKSVTVALQNMAISLDLAFLVRLQRYSAEVKAHFRQQPRPSEDTALYARASQLQQKRTITLPDILKLMEEENAATATGVGRQQVYFGALAVLPCTITLSVAPAQALTPAQAAFEGLEAAAIHKAVRKGDLSLGRNTYPLGVIIGRRNKTALAVAQGVFKSIVVDALLRMDGASLNLSGAFLRNQIFNGPQLTTYLAAHYLLSMRQNAPALLGSLAAIGNPLGLFRGLGDGVSDFVTEPVKGLKKSIKKLDPQYVVDGVARGTGSLARHTVGGFADSAAMLTSTFSKNMAVLTLDRRYAQKRDRGNTMRDQQGDFHLLDGVESGFVKLAQGFIEGVTGVVKAPMRGAERRGFEGFAKGLGKGLLGLLVKPMIGISDAATDVFVGVKSSVEGEGHQEVDRRRNQVRPRRALYGRDKQIQTYNLADAAACALMLRTRIGGQNFLSHLDMDDRVALLSDKRLLLLDSEGKELLLVKFKHISKVEIREHEEGLSLLVILNTPRTNGSELEVITCKDKAQALELRHQIKHGMSLVENDAYTGTLY